MIKIEISIIGLGYIGLPTAAMFASKKIKTNGVDISSEVVETINNGNIHIFEPGLELIVKKAINNGFLEANLFLRESDVYIIAVPTPFKGKYHEPDISYVESAAVSLSTLLKPGDLVILESTSPIGTTEKISERMAELRSDLTFPHQAGEDSDIRVAYCPERVIPGQIIEELVHNDRVIGGMTPRCSKKAKDTYKIFVRGECVLTDSRTAEMSKLAENSFRDVNIAFANELSLICNKKSIDVKKLIDIANLHPRVNILNPGPGVGGHCICVDPWFLIHSAPNETKLINAARTVNDNKPEWVIKKILEIEKKNNIKNIVCMGLAYKPDTDDFRESPSIKIFEALKKRAKKANIFAVEPFITDSYEFEKQLIGISELPKSDTLFVGLVAHTAFKKIDLGNNFVEDLQMIGNSWRVL